jgi:Tol biopolymer transport system component
MAHIFDLDQGTTTEFDVTGGFLDHTVEWSPDGTRLAFSGRHANGRGAVVVSGVDGSGQVPLTPDDVDSEVPVWRR